MKKLILTMMVVAVFISCGEKEKEAAKKDVKKVEKTVEKAEKKAEDLTKEYKTKTGKTFVVTKSGEGSLQTITITPKGFDSNEAIVLTDVDPLGKVFLADLNNDGFEEIYVVTNSAGSGSGATLYAYSSNKDKSVTQINIPEITENDLKGIYKGYMGHDTFYVKDGKLYREFPVYKDGDSNANPTGGKKVLEYKLVPGEAAWQLVLKK
jgi:DNA-binding protein YbaB